MNFLWFPPSPTQIAFSFEIRYRIIYDTYGFNVYASFPPLTVQIPWGQGLSLLMFYSQDLEERLQQLVLNACFYKA